MSPARDSQEFESFPESRWSVLREAAQPDRRAATVEYLARHYWKPLYTYIRRSGFNHEDAKDLTQECFMRLGAGDTLAQVKGDSRFRTWIRALAKHVIINHRKAEARPRRGGNVGSLDIAAIDVPAEGTPDDAFDREWFRSVELQAVDMLLRELARPRDARKREVLERYLLPRVRGDRNTPTFAQVAQGLGCSADDVENDVRRIRGMADSHLRRVIHDTVSSRDDIEAELEALRQQP